jgi:disulfide bond formation protein DsbB
MQRNVLIRVLIVGLVLTATPIRLTTQAANLVVTVNGERYAALAVGVPYENIGTTDKAGSVNVLYGASAGLDATGNQLWYQGDSGLVDTAEQNDLFGYALAVGDFDGDRYMDLAVGVPGETVGGHTSAGAMHILYGYNSTTGLAATGNRLLSQDSPGILDDAENNDLFGAALAAGDFNGDGRDDLAVGVPYESVDGVSYAGAVNVLYGSATSLGGSNALWYQGSPGIEGAAEGSDYFSKALAAGDFNGDGYADLAVGVPNESVDGVSNAGAVNILYGSAIGLTATGNQLWSQNSSDVLGVAEGNDSFGSVLTIGDFNGDGCADLAVGVSADNVDSISGAGAVNILYGSSGGLTATGNQLWSQNSPDILDTAESGDSFGNALASGDFNGDGRDDLAVGVFFEDAGASEIANAGVVNVLYGSATGLTASGNQEWYQDSPGILDESEAGDLFGMVLAAGDFNGDGRDDLAVGVPSEHLGSVVYAGAVNVLYGSDTGLTATGNQFWTQDSPGIGGEAEDHDFFGDALVAIPHSMQRVYLPRVQR